MESLTKRGPNSSPVKMIVSGYSLATLYHILVRYMLFPWSGSENFGFKVQRFKIFLIQAVKLTPIFHSFKAIEAVLNFSQKRD